MTTQPQRARGRADLLTLLAVAAVILVADQLTKLAVINSIAYGERVPVVGDLFILWHVRNTGAAFSLFEGGLILFVVVTVVALGMVAYFHRSFVGRSRWFQVILGVILGGTLGNFVDRLRFGYVTDFLSFGFGETRFPTFNVADSAVVCGIGLLVIILTFFTPETETAAGATHTEART
ncbi:MAG: signal peptidase II [Chloroflexota bacterium]